MNIDKKKEEKKQNSIYPLATRLGIYIFVFYVGISIVYQCRVAQSNLLPTCIEFEPYTRKALDPSETVVNMCVYENASIKVLFSSENNTWMNQTGVLFHLRNMAESETSIYRYIGKTMQMIFCNNLTLLNYIFNFMNETMSETFIIFIGPFLMIFLFFIIYFISMLYGLFLWFTNIGILMGHSKKIHFGTKTIWKDGEAFVLGTFFRSLVYLLIIAVLLFAILPMFLVYIVITFCTFFYSFFIQSTYKDTNVPYNLRETLIHQTKYKLSIFMYILSYILITSVYDKYKLYGLAVGILACLFLRIFTDVYGNYPVDPALFTPELVSFTQTLQLCETDTLGRTRDKLKRFVRNKKIPVASPLPPPYSPPPKAEPLRMDILSDGNAEDLNSIASNVLQGK